MDYTLKIIPDRNGCRYLLCDHNENYYVINRTTYELLEGVQKYDNFAAVAAYMNYLHPDIQVSPYSVQEKVGLIKTALLSGKKNKYVRRLATVIRPNRGRTLYKLLSFFFKKKVFFSLFAIGLFTTVAFLLAKNSDLSFGEVPIVHLPLYYLSFLLLLFFHELGHASASYAYGINPKEIAFGIYLIFPVLYTNVSSIWELNTYKRTVVNVAGIYFQLIANIFLVFAVVLGIGTSVMTVIFILNSISITVSLLPFIKYDGYWIFSDLTGITNLNRKSNDLLLQWITPGDKLNTVNRVLLIYTVLKVFFWLAIYLSASWFLINKVTSTVTSLSSIKHSITIQIAESIMLFILVIFFAVNAILKFLKSLAHARKRISGQQKADI